VPKLFEIKNAEFLWSLRQIYFDTKNKIFYPDTSSALSLKTTSIELIHANEFILIGDAFYNVEFIENIIKKFKNIIKNEKIFFLNKTNMNLINRNFNITHGQFKKILNELGYYRDKSNPVKYIMKNPRKSSENIVIKNKKYINSPFLVLENLTNN
jgi:hypothetical protein